MAIKKTIGGERLGAGRKMQVNMHGYERSTHDISKILRTTMSAGTLVPFVTELMTPGDTMDINLDADVKTHPTVGPLFGSMKLQLDMFLVPIRLYQAMLYNNALGIGMNMQNVKLPQLRLAGYTIDWEKNPDNQQINPSSIFSYLGINGLGQTDPENPQQFVTREFNAVPYLAYFDIYKNYYANKQEEVGAILHTPTFQIIESVENVIIYDQGVVVGTIPYGGSNVGIWTLTVTSELRIYKEVAEPYPDPNTVVIRTTNVGNVPAANLYKEIEYNEVEGYIRLFNRNPYNAVPVVKSWYYREPTDAISTEPLITTFPLINIDKMRDNIMMHANNPEAFVLSEEATFLTPYSLPMKSGGGYYSKLFSQEGLLLKTYQSDIFNNWLQTEWIDGESGVNAITAIDTSSGSFTIEALQLGKKVYDMLNRIAISGGSYDDWQDAVYAHSRPTMLSAPMYIGGLSKEIIFQEVVSSAESMGDNSDSPLGALAGRGVLSNKHKGGHITAKADEPSYLIGIASITPRIDYSQGNRWDTNLKTLDDLHKPALDEIGFQDLVTDKMASWDTTVKSDWSLEYKSAGKQPAWLDYMTNYNEVKGNFAIEENEMFMVLTRRYEADKTNKTIKDLTTYIDPVKSNYIFAQTSRDAMNFWVQIKVDNTARRKMSAKIMPNL